MSMHPGTIDLPVIKTLIAFILFMGTHEHEHSTLSHLRRIKNTAWN
jgi:hypothetical protein